MKLLLSCIKKPGYYCNEIRHQYFEHGQKIQISDLN